MDLGWVLYIIWYAVVRWVEVFCTYVDAIVAGGGGVAPYLHLQELAYEAVLEVAAAFGVMLLLRVVRVALGAPAEDAGVGSVQWSWQDSLLCRGLGV